MGCSQASQTLVSGMPPLAKNIKATFGTLSLASQATAYPLCKPPAKKHAFIGFQENSIPHVVLAHGGRLGDPVQARSKLACALQI